MERKYRIKVLNLNSRTDYPTKDVRLAIILGQAIHKETGFGLDGVNVEMEVEKDGEWIEWTDSKGRTFKEISVSIEEDDLAVDLFE